MIFLLTPFSDAPEQRLSSEDEGKKAQLEFFLNLQLSSHSINGKKKTKISIEIDFLEYIFVVNQRQRCFCFAR